LFKWGLKAKEKPPRISPEGPLAWSLVRQLRILLLSCNGTVFVYLISFEQKWVSKISP